MPHEPAVLDTNVLVYALYADSPHHTPSRRLLHSASDGAAKLYVTPQTLAEFFAVVTSARRVTAPKTAEEAILAIEAILALPGVSLLEQPTDAVTRWCQLARRRPVRGAQIFDLQLVAAMLAAGIRRIYTFNNSDFEPFAELNVVVPS
jgi:toxin-antitoxin system PIN domain toxin